MQLSALCQQAGACLTMDSAINATAAQKGPVCCVYNAVHIKVRYIAVLNLNVFKFHIFCPSFVWFVVIITCQLGSVNCFRLFNKNISQNKIKRRITAFKGK
jgi:hypothetical protein